MPYVASVEKEPISMLKNDAVRKMKRHEMTEAILNVDPTMNKNYAHRLAGNIKRAAERRDLGFYEALRILGIYTDTTARDAVRNAERAVAA